MKVFVYIRKNFWPILYLFGGAAVVATGWNYYHYRVFARTHPLRFMVLTVALWLAVAAAAYAGGRVFAWLTRRSRRHWFWQQDFITMLPEFFFTFSLLFAIFFFRWQLMSGVYVLGWGVLVFWRTRTYLARHPAASAWLAVHRRVFLLAGFIFTVQVLCQYAAYRLYILDSDIRFFNIVVFRAVAMTSFWMLGFAVAGLVYWKLPRYARHSLLVLWSLFFVFGMFIWSINIGTLYLSGLHFSPVALAHIMGAGAVGHHVVGYGLAVLFALALALFIFVMRSWFYAHDRSSARQWVFYNLAIILVAFGGLLGVSSLRHTPERLVLASFYEHWFGEPQAELTLPPALQEKLRRFGLSYRTDQFAVSHREKIFQEQKPLLPAKLRERRPNIVIIFLEGFSSRLTGVYNPRFADVTPHLNAFAADRNTTVFKKYFNASTPTITGTASQLCSFLPPTGHEEIQTKGKIQGHRLLCLPEILKRHGGYGYAGYATAVSKTYSHKDGIFGSAGVDEVLGTEELKKYIDGIPLSWGYSDHQLFGALPALMEERRDEKPFLMMLATVDTHPPFTLSKDVVKYSDGGSPVLNMFHTTDHAFGEWWKKFQQSELKDNTIVVAVADHAIFPAAINKDLFRDEAKSLTFYDENTFMIHVPDTVLPKTVERYSSGLDLAPTLLHLLGINVPNGFEGHSIFDDREKFPNLLGMHELGLYINQVVDASGKRKMDYNVPERIECIFDPAAVNAAAPLTLCEFKYFYQWKRQMFETGRLWSK